MCEDRTRRHYEPRVRPDSPGHRIADWADATSQQIRFEALVKHVELAGRSLLDVGCGTGDLWTFLKERDIRVDYLGVDLVDKMVAEARRRHPDGHFACLDIFEPGPPAEKKFDVVFASGVFNLDVGNNRQLLPKGIARLLELSGDVTVFNLLHARAQLMYSHCVYWQPDKVRAILADFPGRVELIDDYLVNDFTVICRRQ